MEKRFQVFVSSTYQDLQEERQEVMHALLELDCIPSGMELFPAANEAQWSLIKKVIDDCDYYVLILGGRYGSIGPNGLSYTEMEYRYALETGKPTIAFLHRDVGKIIADKSESTPDGKAKLKEFRDSVEKKLCKHWATPQELGSVVSRSLVQLIKSTPAVGWVRANELADRDATMELLKLRRRVEEVEGELAKARTSAPKGTEGLSQGGDTHELRFSFEAQSDSNPYIYQTWTSSFYASWNDLFAATAPHMIHEVIDAGLEAAIDEFVKERNITRLRENKNMKDKAMRSFSLKEEDFQTVKVQLRALGLIVKSEKPRSVKDSGTYWTLTPYGDELMTRIRAIKRPPSVAEDMPPPARKPSEPKS